MQCIPATVIDVALALMRDLGPLMHQFEMKFTHHLDIDRLARALDLLFEAEPILGCRLTVSTFSAYWEPLGTTGRSCLTTVLDEEAFAAFRVQDLASSSGPQIQVGHLRTSGGDSLLIKMTHEVCDGGGLKETAAILADLYNRLLAEPQHRQRTFPRAVDHRFQEPPPVAAADRSGRDREGQARERGEDRPQRLEEGDRGAHGAVALQIGRRPRHPGPAHRTRVPQRPRGQMHPIFRPTSSPISQQPSPPPDPRVPSPHPTKSPTRTRPAHARCHRHPTACAAASLAHRGCRSRAPAPPAACTWRLPGHCCRRLPAPPSSNAPCGQGSGEELSR